MVWQWSNKVKKIRYWCLYPGTHLYIDKEQKAFANVYEVEGGEDSSTHHGFL